MKDLVLRNSGDNSLVGTLRCEMLSNAPAQFEPVEIKNNQGKIVDQLIVGTQVIQKINYSWPQFVTKCSTDNIKIVSSNSNGSSPVNIN
jgi:hypothetical protein